MKSVAATALAAFALLLGACSSSDPDVTPTTDYGQIRTEDQVATDESTAIIAGPAKVDSEGRLYTSSSAGSAGNAASLGTNTNVTIIPEQPRSTVVVTTSPAFVEPPPPPVVVVEAPPPPVIVAVPAPPPPPVVIMDDEPMISSVQEETRTRMSKD